MIVCDRCREQLAPVEIYERHLNRIIIPKVIDIDLCLVCRDNLRELLTEWLKGERKDA